MGCGSFAGWLFPNGKFCAGDGHGDRFIVDHCQQVVQRWVVLAGRPVPDAGRGVRAVAPPVGHAVGDRFGPAVPWCEPLAGWHAGRGAGGDAPLLVALGVAGSCRVAGGRVGPGGQFCPQPVGDAEHRLDDQVRKVMDDVNGTAPGDPAGGQPGTVPVARAGQSRPHGTTSNHWLHVCAIRATFGCISRPGRSADGLAAPPRRIPHPVTCTGGDHGEPAIRRGRRL